MTERNTIVRAAAISPLAAPILYFVGAILFNREVDLELNGLFHLALVLLFIAAPVSYIATLVLGVPYYRLLKKLNRVSGVNLILGGVVFGVVTFLLFWATPFGLGLLTALDREELLNIIGIGAVLGGGVACCFYLLSGITNRST
ncbi:MAG: hypothetical protein AB2794_21210 [Candidatus Thiodiazotropha endolucinida]